MTTDGVLGAAFLPTDGYIDPSQLTFALAEGARRRGAEIATGTRVTGVAVQRGRVTRRRDRPGARSRPRSSSTRAACSRRRSARSRASNVPIVPMAHEYLITKPTGLPLEMPTMRDPSLLVYFRPESGGLIMGGYERHCEPWGLDGIPADFNSRLLEEDWPRFEELMENAIARVPSLGEMEVVKLINGPEAFTPDGEFILGPSDVRGFWVAAGFCAHGLAGAGGMGKLVAEWIVEGTPSLDVWHMDSRRFGRAYRSREYTLARTKEIYETYYDVKYPGHERSAGRPLRVSSAYERLQQLGAAFGEKSGWERANWFEPNAANGDESLRPRGWAGKHWSPAIGAEHLACRETAAIFDESSFAKILVSGEGAADLLESALREPRRPRGRAGDLHADAQSAGRDRVRLHGHAPRRGSLPDRDGDGVRSARPRVDRAARSRRRLRPGRRRDVGVRLLRPVGAAGARHPAAAHERRPGERGVPVHACPRARGRARPLSRAARDLRRRARLGALLSERVRGRALGHDLGGRTGARARGRRLQGDRLAAAREGLPRVGRRHHARGHAVRGGTRLRRQARQGRLRRPRGARLARRSGAASPVPHARGSAGDRPRLGAGSRGRRSRRPGDERRLRIHGREVHRVRVPARRARRRHRDRGRDLRRVGARRRRGRAAVRSRRASGSAHERSSPPRSSASGQVGRLASRCSAAASRTTT